MRVYDIMCTLCDIYAENNTVKHGKWITNEGRLKAIRQSNYYFRVTFSKAFLQYRTKKPRFRDLGKSLFRSNESLKNLVIMSLICDKQMKITGSC